MQAAATFSVSIAGPALRPRAAGVLNRHPHPLPSTDGNFHGEMPTGKSGAAMEHRIGRELSGAQQDVLGRLPGADPAGQVTADEVPRLRHLPALAPECTMQALRSRQERNCSASYVVPWNCQDFAAPRTDPGRCLALGVHCPPRIVRVPPSDFRRCQNTAQPGWTCGCITCHDEVPCPMGASGSAQAICSPIGRGDDVAASPTMRRRRLAAELRRLRHDAGLSIEDVTAGLGWQPSKLSRIENRQVGISTADLRKLFVAYKVADSALRDQLADMARRATERGWWQSFSSDVVPSALANLIGLETEARTIRSYEPELVPGLLQTEAYARAIMRAWQPSWTASDIDRRVEIRLGRQDVLRQPGVSPQVSCVINEAVLRRSVGGNEVMHEQVEVLAKERDPANVTVQVLPFNSGAHPAMAGPFQVLTFYDPGDLGVVHLESAMTANALERPEELRRYDEIWGALLARALSPEDSRVMMRSYALRYAGHF
jgi:transcriptional regulator with XRE-family HTH domain